MNKLLCAALLAAMSSLAFGTAGCSKDQNDYSTWTAKLNDPRASEEAVTHLEQLGDPRAIPALGAAWKDQGYPPHLLEMIIALASPMTAQEADAKSFTDFDGKEGRQDGRPESRKRPRRFLSRPSPASTNRTRTASIARRRRRRRSARRSCRKGSTR